MRNWDTLGAVRIGSTVTIGTYLLPALIRKFQAEFPELRVDVKVCKASQVEKSLLDNELDLGLMEAQPEHPDLCAVPFRQDELRAVVPPASALCERRSLTIQDLASYPFLMREPGSAGRKVLDAYLALHHMSIRPAWESVSTQAIVKAVAEGLGVAVLPQMLVERDAQEGNVVMLPFEEPLVRTLHIVYHRRKYLSSNMQRFIALCREGEESCQ